MSADQGLKVRRFPMKPSSFLPPSRQPLPLFCQMARISTLFVLCAAAIVATASPVVVRDSPVSLPLARRIASTGSAKIIEQDQARAALLKNVGHGKRTGESKRAPDLQAVNALSHYTVEVGIGEPATTYTLLVDTGSANTFIGLKKAYTKTSTSKDTGNSVVSQLFSEVAPCMNGNEFEPVWWKYSL